MANSDRALIEEAATKLSAAAPADWTRLVAEFEPFASPVVARASAACGPQLVPLDVPGEAVTLVGEYQNRTATSGATGRRVLIVLDRSGALQVHTGTAPSVAAEGPFDDEAARNPLTPSGSDFAASRAADLSRPWVPLWVWAVLAIASTILLAVAVRDSGNGLTLRAMAASESMSADDARAVAENTVRVWLQARNTFNVANFDQLTCPGELRDERAALLRHRPSSDQTVNVTWGLNRAGPEWKLAVDFTNGQNIVFVMKIVDGGLRVCDFEQPPTEF